MSNTGVQKMRGRFATLFAVLMLMVGASMLVGSAASAHTPDGWSQTDLLQGNTNQQVAGVLSYSYENGTLALHWHVDEEFDGEVTDQFVCIGSYPTVPPADRCKPGQAPDGTVFHADPIGADEWSIEYDGDITAFQLHLSISGETLVSSTEVEGSDDDGTTDDGTVDDGTTDDGTVDDGTTDDGTTDDGTTDDGTTDDGTTDDGTVDDGTTDDGTVDDGTTDDGTVDDGTEVQGNTVVKPKPQVGGKVLAQTGPETTMLTILGLTFLMLGVAMRVVRFGASPVMATPANDALVARTLDLVDRMVNRNSRWDCRS